MTINPQSDPGLQNWKLTLAYDGTDFQGWQVQPGLPTVQGELQAALGRITGESHLPQGSGRTDAGVHALAQVASFTLRAPIPPDNLLRALNRTLPPSIRISETKHACEALPFMRGTRRFAKTYEYPHPSAPRDCSHTFLRPLRVRLPLGRFRSMRFRLLRGSLKANMTSSASPQPIPIERTGFWPRKKKPEEHDSTCCATAAAAKTGKIRTVFSSTWEQRSTDACDLLLYRVRGNGFLHHMVRNLVGTMIDVARGQLALDEIPRIIAARSRSEAGPTAPARGLFLHSVDYPPEDL